jgi:arsenite-transporting ATPase
MSLILTFLGKGGSGSTTVAIAAAKKMASLGSRVLLIGQDPSAAWGILLGVSPSSSPTEIAANLTVVQLQTTQLLERGWEEVKELESKYLRSPTLKHVYGQELGILPGMDHALALNALREYDHSGKYDVIIYDGGGDVGTLRMLGIPEVLSWYIRRFRQVLTDSDVGKALSPFLQPITSAIFNVAWSPDDLSNQPTNQATDLLEEGKAALSDPRRVLAYLVTTEEPAAIATAKYLWGSAQQIGLTVGGVLVNQTSVSESLRSEFAPLTLSELPTVSGNDWQPLIDALPNFRPEAITPKPLVIDTVARQVRVFLPGFAKNQVKLTQYGPELTIEAGDQRRNIDVPPPLRGQAVKGAKFQDGYLIISF